MGRWLFVALAAFVFAPFAPFAEARAGDVVVRRGLFGRTRVVVRRSRPAVVVRAAPVVVGRAVVVNRFAVGRAVVVQQGFATVATPVVIQNATGFGGVTVVRGGCGALIIR